MIGGWRAIIADAFPKNKEDRLEASRVRIGGGKGALKYSRTRRLRGRWPHAYQGERRGVERVSLIVSCGLSEDGGTSAEGWSYPRRANANQAKNA